MNFKLNLSSNVIFVTMFLKLFPSNVTKKIILLDLFQWVLAHPVEYFVQNLTQVSLHFNNVWAIT